MRRSLQLKVTNRRKYPAATSTAFELALAVPDHHQGTGGVSYVAFEIHHADQAYERGTTRLRPLATPAFFHHEPEWASP